MRTTNLSDNRIKKSSNAGFTMVEMIVTIIIFSIIAALTAVGVLAYQDWATFKKENEYAQTLFVAAQNQLTEFSADGRLETMRRDMLGIDENAELPKEEEATYVVGSTLDITGLTSESGSGYDLAEVFADNAGLTDKIISLRATQGQFEAYLNDPDGFKAANAQAYWVFELLGSYVYDIGILNGGAIAVEITPADGQVFSVLYTDKADAMYYSSMAEAANGVDISDRREEPRRDKFVGYYGVDTLSASVGVENAKRRAEITKVRLYNDDTLYMTFKVSEGLGELQYEINLLDADKAKKSELTILMDGSKLKNKASAEAVLCEITRYDLNASGQRVAKDDGTFLGLMPVMAWIEKDKTVHIVLDAMDIQATAYLYDDEYTKLHSYAANESLKGTDTVDGNQPQFYKTYSFFRFGLNVDDVYASVKGSGAGYVDTKEANNMLVQRPKNTCFAGGEENKSTGKYAYTIRNPRHLSNIRYIEASTYEKQAPQLGSITEVKYTVKEDIDFKSFQEDTEDGRNVFNSAKGATPNVSLATIGARKGETVTRFNCDFPSLPQLRDKAVLEGGNNVISGINVSELSNAVYQEYIVDVNGTKKISEYTPAGFINYNYGKVENLKLDKFTVKGSDMVGGFIGYNLGSLKKLETLNTDEKSSVTGLKNVGGIIGFQMPNTRNNVNATVYDGISEQNVNASYMAVETLTNRAKVEGVEAVGGIVGMLRNDFSMFKNKELREFTGLTQKEINEIRNNNGKNGVNILIRDCKNYGAVLGENKANLKGLYITGSGAARATPEELATEPRYIGGVVGYTYNQYEDATYRLTVMECVSSPQYDSTTLGNLIGNKADVEDKLKGAYVGGIVGYNYYGQINACSTRPESGKEGYIFGYQYVGGIVGLNIGPTSGIVGATNDEKGTNYNNVVAYEYAGGIVGCNAKMKDPDGTTGNNHGNGNKDGAEKDPESLTVILEPDITTHLYSKVDSWINKGIIVATNKYAGGITGYNTGWVYRCNSVMEQSKADAGVAGLESGDYVGGVVGYNNGVVGNTSRTIDSKSDGKTSSVSGAGSHGLFPTKCYVRGHNYTGGIVGYNDVNSIIEDYQVAGGYVLGAKGSCFVGGYAGLNASIDLLMDLSSSDKKARLVHSNANQVEGDYFVGGNIGGNIINMNDHPEVNEVKGVFKTDNFLGTLKGRAFLGGYVGYNCVFENKANSPLVTESQYSDKGATFIVQQYIADAFKESDKHDDLSDQEKLIEKKEILDSLARKVKITPSDKGILLTGSDEVKNRTSLGSISGEIYVGGVLGYNDDSTVLYIKNVENSTPIVAKNAIEYEDERHIIYDEVKKEYIFDFFNKEGAALDDRSKKENYHLTDYTGEKKKYTYSYVGGIMGKVSRRATIENCWNGSTGVITTKGTYTGGLCEINEGKIIKCDVLNFGNSLTDYVGGLCGYNKNIIEECRVNKKTVSGRNVVGSIAAENYGIIRKIEFTNSKLRASFQMVKDADGVEYKDGVAGLYAGFNGATGIIEIEKDLGPVDVQSAGRFVGGIVGVNDGSFAYTKAKADHSVPLSITGKVQGDMAVGGFIGKNNSKKPMYDLNNEAQVIAVNGTAGGIVGVTTKNSDIEYCTNKGMVTATYAGNAGGIVAKNTGYIGYCRDFVTVSAPNGMCGGICAENVGELDKDNKLTGGKIELCLVQPQLATETIELKSAKAVGGVTGQNSGIVAKNTLENVKITNYTTTIGTSIGIIAGDNLKNGQIVLDERLDVKNSEAVAETNQCNVGGIAGTNAGLIEGIKDATTGLPLTVIEGNVRMGDASYASMGGVAGYNTGKIRNISVDSKIEGNLGAADSGYGGIAGYADTKDSVITNCTFDGSIHAIGSAGAPARIGGIVGINGKGSDISYCYIGARDVDINGNVTDVAKTTSITAGDTTKRGTGATDTDANSNANIGGIAGENYGRIGDMDQNTMSKDKVEIISFGGASGGITGANWKDGVISGTDATHRITTSPNWTIEMLRVENDRGPSGIMGLNYSGADVKHVDNYAKVVTKYNGNSKCAGLICMELQTQTPQHKIIDCNNYGNISGNAMTGGFIAQIRTRGVAFTNCSNYGRIHSTGKTSHSQSGGLVAYLAESFVGEMTFTNCSNHGLIMNEGTGDAAGHYNGGFLGEITGNTVRPVDLNFYNCVNTGLILREDMADYDAATDTYTPNVTKVTSTNQGRRGGGFVGNLSSGNKAYLTLCRNYDVSNLNRGFVGTGGSVYLKDCLDATDFVETGAIAAVEKSPVGGTVTATDKVYYLNPVSNRFEDKGGAYFTAKIENNVDVQVNSKNLKALQNPAVLFNAPSESLKINAAFNSTSTTQNGESIWQLFVNYDNDCSGMDAFNIYFWNGATGGTSKTALVNYSYRAELTDINGHVAVVGAQNADGKYSVSDDYKGTIVIPDVDINGDPFSKKVVGIRLFLKRNSSGNVFMHGFSWNPVGKTAEYKCDYMPTTFNVSAINSISTKTRTDFSNKSLGTYYVRYVDDYLLAPFMPLTINADGGFVANDNPAGGTPDENSRYRCFGYKLESNDGVNEFSTDIDVHNADASNGMKSFVFYGANNVTATSARKNYGEQDVRRYCYTGKVIFTDTDGNMAEVPFGEGPTYAIHSYGDLDWNISKTVVDVPVGTNGLTSNISHIRLVISGVRYTAFDKTGVEKSYTNDLNVRLRGFAWIPNSTNKLTAMSPGAGSNQTATLYDMFATGTNLIELGVKSNITADSATKPNWVYEVMDPRYGFSMKNDPVSALYYGDHREYAASEADENNSRITTFEEIDPKFLEFANLARETLEPLKEPTNFDITIVDGEYRLVWDRVTNAVGYDVSYVVTDAAGNIVMSGTDYQQDYSSPTIRWRDAIKIPEAWVDEGGYVIMAQVRAVNAYRFNHPDAEDPYAMDSGWVYDSEVISKKMLLQPEVHMEITNSNMTMCILDNYQDYVDANLTDCCNVIVEYGTKSGLLAKYVIDFANGPIANELLYLTSAGFNVITAYAEPKDELMAEKYTKSTIYSIVGAQAPNSAMTDDASWVHKNAAINFKGFYGTEADNMTYEIQIKNGEDAFIKTDLEAYDNVIGSRVVYSANVTHVAKAGTTGIGDVIQTSTLDKIPEKWFASDNIQEIIARAYCYRSQSEMAHYGHMVAENIALTETYEKGQTDLETEANRTSVIAANQAVLAEIKDIYRFRVNPDKAAVSEPDKLEDVLITDDDELKVWDSAKNCLKPGYSLVRTAEGVYNIEYSALLELASKRADEFKSTSTLVNREQVPYMGCYVSYKTYDYISQENARAKGLTLEGARENLNVNGTNYSQSYWTRTTDDAEGTLPRSKSRGTTVNVRLSSQKAGDFWKFYEDINTAPVIDAVDSAYSNNGNGEISFTFTWDEYFKDTYCMDQAKVTNTKTRYESTNADHLTNAELENGMGYRDAEGNWVSMAPKTWNDFVTRTDFRSTNGKNSTTVRMVKMNQYLSMYETAQYKATLYGITDSGDEVELQTKTNIGGDTGVVRNELSQVDKDYTIGGVTVNKPYLRYNYGTTFTGSENEWNYAKYKVRVEHIGTQGTVPTYNFNDGNSVVYATFGNTLNLPRYEEANVTVKLPLAQVDNPSVSMSKDASDNLRTDGMLYDVEWGAITDPAQIADLGGYMIIVRQTEGNASGGDPVKPHYYYVDAEATAASDVLALDFVELKRDGVVRHIPNEEYTASADGKRKVTLDLADFNDGDEVEVCIRTLARANAEFYTDSLEGSAATLVLSVALPTPTISDDMIVASDSMAVYDDALYIDENGIEYQNTVNVDDYEKGFVIKYLADANYAGKTGVKIVMAAAIFDAVPDVATIDPEDPWNKNAVYTIYDKDSPFEIGDPTLDATGTLNIKAIEEAIAVGNMGEFAGKWIKLVFKATHPTDMDSRWTDVDSGATQCLWIHIPKLFKPEAPLGIGIGEDPTLIPSPSPMPELGEEGDNPNPTPTPQPGDDENSFDPTPAPQPGDDEESLPPLPEDENGDPDILMDSV